MVNHGIISLRKALFVCAFILSDLILTFLLVNDSFYRGKNAQEWSEDSVLANLSDHDAVRRHSQRFVDQHLDRDRATTLGVGQATL